MINYIEYLNLPAKIAIYLVGGFFILQVIGELLEFKGKVVPEFVKIRKYFARKRAERETTQEMAKTLKGVQLLLEDVRQHYSEDNIKMRDAWMQSVNAGLAESKDHWRELNEAVVSLLIDSKRNTIIAFADRVIDPNCVVTREEFNRIFKLYEEYEAIIEKYGMTNGEVEISMRIIREAYEERLKHHTFIEYIRGYDN